jgi:hypothetical protein
LGSLAAVPTVSFAVGTKQLTVNPADFAFGDAGNGMTFGGVRVVHFIIVVFIFFLTIILPVDPEQG